MIWLAALFISCVQDPAGLRVTDAGLGFLPLSEIANLRAPRAEHPNERYVARPDAWTTCQLTLSNTGDALSGVLRLRARYAEENSPVRYEKRISLPSGTTKRFTFPVLNNSIYPFELTFEDDARGRVPIGGRPEALVGQPRLAPVTSELVLVATNSAAPLGHFLARRGDGTPLPDRILVPIAPAHLPRTALEYQGVDVLILDDVPVDALSSAQQQAIVQFAHRGGLVVICLASQAQRLTGTPVEAILPAHPGELRNADALPLLESLTGISCPLDPPQAIVTLTPKPGAESWSGDAGAIVHGRADRGTVVAFGFPITARFLERWPGAPLLLEVLLNVAQPPAIGLPGSSPAQAFRERVASALKGSVTKSIPPFGVVVGIMGGYVLAVVFLPYAVFRPLRRLEWAWAAVLLLALVGSGVVYGVGVRHVRAGALTVRATLVEGGAASGTHMRHNFWCLYATSTDRVSLRFEETPTVPYVLGRELALRGMADAEPLRIADDEDAQIRAMQTYFQDTVLFETTDACATPGRLRFDVLPSADEADPEGLVGTLAREGDFPLRAAWVVHQGRAVPVREGSFPIGADPPPAALAAGSPRATQAPRFFEKIFEVFAQEAAHWSRERQVPILLYQYEGHPSLADDAIHEEALHFGILEPRTWAPDRRDAALWRALIRRPFQKERPDDGIEFTLVTAGLPPDAQVRQLSLVCNRSHVSTLQFEAYNRRTRKWVRFRERIFDEPDDYVLVSPLGRAQVRCRATARSAHDVWIFHQMNENDLYGSSRVLRPQK